MANGFELGRLARRWRSRTFASETVFHKCIQRLGLLHRDRDELHLIARLELPDLPQLCMSNHCRTDKATEARTIGAEDDRHVAGEVDGTNGIRIVMDVRWMQACLATIWPRPRRLGSDQANAGACGVVVHFPLGAEEHRDVFRREEVRRAVWAVDNADAQVVSGLSP